MREVWHLSEDRTSTPFRLFVNGLVDHPYMLSGVDCPGFDKWASLVNLPIECPHEIRKELEAARSEQPCMPLERFRTNVDRWQIVFKRIGVEVSLQPGNSFWPSVWRVPSKPIYEFYWAIGEVIISSRIATLIHQNAITGVSLSPVILKSCGTLRPNKPIPTSILERITDEMDLLEYCPSSQNPAACGDFFSMLTSVDTYELAIADSGPHDSYLACGRLLLSRDKEKEMKQSIAACRDKNIIPRRYVPAVDVFRSHIYSNGIVVNERFFSLLEKTDLQNCTVRNLTIT